MIDMKLSDIKIYHYYDGPLAYAGFYNGDIWLAYIGDKDYVYFLSNEIDIRLLEEDKISIRDFMKNSKKIINEQGKMDSFKNIEYMVPEQGIFLEWDVES